jgi:hypothetical protein
MNADWNGALLARPEEVVYSRFDGSALPSWHNQNSTSRLTSDDSRPKNEDGGASGEATACSYRTDGQVHPPGSAVKHRV